MSIATSHPASVGADRRQIFVCGDLHNLGDLKLLLQNLSLTKGRGGLVRRWSPLPEAIERQVAMAGGELVPGRAILAFAWRAFGQEIVLGGGQLVRNNVSVMALIGLLLAVTSARLGGGRMVTRGLGVSPIHSPLRRWLWQRVLSACAVVNLRDDASARHLSSLLPDQPQAVHADMVFLPTDGAHAIVPGAGQRQWVVIAPCVDGSEERSLEGEALDAVVAAALSALPQAGVMIACHDPRGNMDKAAAAKLIDRWPDRDVEIHDGYELSALIALYRDAAIVVTNRLHALIFAILAEAPVLAVEDGTAKVRVVADRFAIPVIARSDATTAHASVQAALAFDRAARERMRHQLGVKAAGNL